MKHHHSLVPALLLGLLSSFTAHADDDVASVALSPRIKVVSDQRSRGISDSLLRPGVKLGVDVAHESGLVGLVELGSVSKKQFLGSSGYNVLLGAGWRAGDPDGLHYGVGLAAELFPGAGYEAPHAFDTATGASLNVRRTRYNSTFAVLEAGYGALDVRALNVVSKTYRGVDTGGICGTELQLDPTAGTACYARGDRNSRGTWLLDLDYKIHLNSQTTLNLHAGFQRVKNFKEANLDDYAIGITHKRWGFDFTAEWIVPRANARDLYRYQDGARLRAADNNRLVLSVARML